MAEEFAAKLFFPSISTKLTPLLQLRVNWGVGEREQEGAPNVYKMQLPAAALQG